MEKENEREINLSFLWTVFKRGALWIISVALLVSIAVGAYTVAFMKDSYSATFGFWVTNATGTAHTSTTLSAAAQIATDSTMLVKTNKTVKRVVQEGGLAKYFGCDEELATNRVMSMISASKPSETSLIFNVKITSSNKEDALAVAKAMQDSLPFIIEEVNNLPATSSFVRIISEVDTISDVRTHSPSLLSNVMLSAVISAMLAYGILLVLAIMNTVVYDEGNIKEAFEDIPVIGTIPEWLGKGERAVSRHRGSARKRRAAAEQKGFGDYSERLIDESTPFAVTEAFNTLCTGVMYSVAAEKCQVFVVSGEIPGVGKSIVAANLAKALTNHGKRVLLVECDMRRPCFSHIFGAKAERGLSEFLSGNVESSKDIITKYNNLDVIQAGHVSPNPSVLLSSERMQNLIAEWRESYDMVILDTPPICNVVDSRVIAKHVNGYIFVVRSGYSDMREVKQAVGYLDELGAKIVGFVVNDKDLKGRVGYKYSRAYRNYGLEESGDNLNADN